MTYTLIPRPDSNEELLEIIVKFCDSSLVSRILGIEGGIHIELEPYFKKSYLPVISFSTPLAYGYYYFYDKYYNFKPSTQNDFLNFLKQKRKDFQNFPVQTGVSAKENKTLGLCIEPEDKADIRLKKCSPNPKYRSVYLLPSGLNGIKRVSSFIKDGFFDNGIYIGSVPEFTISVYSLGNEWINEVETKLEKEILDSLRIDEGPIERCLDNEHNKILVNTWDYYVELGSTFPERELERFINEI